MPVVQQPNPALLPLRAQSTGWIGRFVIPALGDRVLVDLCASSITPDTTTTMSPGRTGQSRPLPPPSLSRTINT